MMEYIGEIRVRNLQIHHIIDNIILSIIFQVMSHAVTKRNIFSLRISELPCLSNKTEL